MAQNRKANELDLTTTVTTPEHVQFEYKLAGFTRRFPAFLIDVVLRVVFFVAMIVAFACSGISAYLPFSEVMFTVLAILSMFALSWLYGIFFEIMWNGRTPGKRLVGIRAVMADGRPLTTVAVIVRNFLRIADVLPILMLPIKDSDIEAFPIPLFLFSAICMTLNSRFQRLGDIAANTIVIVEEPEYAHRHQEIRDQRIESIALQLPPDFVLKASLVQSISLYIERRGFLTPSHREELCSIITSPLRERYELPKDVNNDSIVCALHYREFYLRDDQHFDLETVA